MPLGFFKVFSTAVFKKHENVASKTLTEVVEERRKHSVRVALKSIVIPFLFRKTP